MYVCKASVRSPSQTHFRLSLQIQCQKRDSSQRNASRDALFFISGKSFLQNHPLMHKFQRDLRLHACMWNADADFHFLRERKLFFRRLLMFSSEFHLNNWGHGRKRQYLSHIHWFRSVWKHTNHWWTTWRFGSNWRCKRYRYGTSCVKDDLLLYFDLYFHTLLSLLVANNVSLK